MRIVILVMIALAFPIAATAGSTTLATSETERSLGRDPVKVSLSLPDGAASEASGRLRVVIEDLRLVRPGAVYQVYLNLPAGQAPDPRSLHYLGHVAAFGKVRDDDPGSRRSFDITDQVEALRDSGEWTGEIELTFVRGNPEPPSAGDGEAAGGKAEEFLRFSRVSIIERHSG